MAYEGGMSGWGDAQAVFNRETLTKAEIERAQEAIEYDQWVRRRQTEADAASKAAGEHAMQALPDVLSALQLSAPPPGPTPPMPGQPSQPMMQPGGAAGAMGAMASGMPPPGAPPTMPGGPAPGMPPGAPQMPPQGWMPSPKGMGAAPPSATPPTGALTAPPMTPKTPPTIPPEFAAFESAVKKWDAQGLSKADQYAAMQKLGPMVNEQNKAVYDRVREQAEIENASKRAAEDVRESQEREKYGMPVREMSPEIKMILAASGGDLAKFRQQIQLLATKHETLTKSQRVGGGGGGAVSGKLDADTLGQMAEQYLAGDKSVASGLGYGNVGAGNRAALRQAIYKLAKERKMTGADIAAKLAEYSGLTAGERTLGVRTANVEMAVKEADTMATLVSEASHQVNRTQFMPINRAIVAWEKNTGDVEVRKLGAAINSFINAYARAVSPAGVPTVADKEHAREILSTADSQQQLDGIIEQMHKEMLAAQGAPSAVREELRSAIAGGKTLPAEAKAKLKKGQTTTFGNGQTWTLDESGNPKQVK